MKPTINVLVTPAGSGMAIVAIKALLEDRRIRVIAADMDRLAAGLFLAHKGYIVPQGTSDPFFNAIEKIVRKENVHVILPCLDTFLLPFCERKNDFERVGVKIVLSPPETLKICRDKWLLYKKLHRKIAMPRSVILSGSSKSCLDSSFMRKSLSFPVVVKPRAGSGSKHVFIAEDAEELKVYLRKVREPVIQEYITGEEYTVDMLVNKDHKPLVIVPRRRLETRAGISAKGMIEVNEELINVGKRLCDLLDFFGPVNFQIIFDRRDGVPKLIEVNPRIAGGMSLTVAAGVNIPLLSVYLAVGEKVVIKHVHDGLYMSRYFEEIVLTANDLRKLTQL
jgi:carbamoyl-phosphate synthase large subunit